MYHLVSPSVCPAASLSQISDSENIPDASEPAKKKTKHKELKDFLEMTTPTPSLSLSTLSEVLHQVKREMAIFESTGERPACLQKIFRAIKTLPPTSVEAERAFSSAGLFITKIRSQLSDRSIDSLCFLRYFQNRE